MGGADPLKKNSKNRTARGQAKIPEHVSLWLCDIEDEAKRAKEQKRSAVWGQLLQVTQTESAFGVQVL
jgi:hypothetical protein